MQTNKKLTLTKIVFSFIVLAGTFFLAGKLLSDDSGAFMKWWLTLLLLGIVFQPLSAVLFKSFKDNGWIFSKAIGMAFSGWLLWVLSSFKLLKFTFMNCIIVVSICLLLNLVILFVVRKKKGTRVLESFNLNLDKAASIVAIEAIFTFAFLIWVYLRCFKPEAYGTEKFMDYGFMTAILRSEYMPPYDPWLSGNTINYYYVGQYLSSYMTRLSGVTAGEGYNLMLMTIAAMGFAMPYSIIVNVADTFASGVHKISAASRSCFTAIAGVLAGISVSLISNLQYVIYALIIPHTRDLLGLTEAFKSLGYNFDAYWFPNATRYIGYFPQTNDKTIHEFPLYSFVLGDLHAHVINIIFVLTVIALLFSWLADRKAKMDAARLRGEFALGNKKGCILGIENFVSEVFNPSVISVGFFIGLFHMTNFWDYPIYFVVSGAVILFSNAVIYNFKFATIKLTALHAVVVLGVAKLVSLPFNLCFNKISSSVCIADNHTPLYQLLILWGLPVICVVAFVVVCVKNQKLKSVFAENSSSKISGNALFKFIGNLEISDLFVIILGLCAIGLVIIPELIYVKDIYTGDYRRANTMFKLTYQAFIMFGMVMGYVITKALFFAKTKARTIWSIAALALIILSMGYFFNSTKAWFGDYTNLENRKTLDASAFIETENPEDAAAINWLNENVQGSPVVLEVNGDSYSYCERVSVLTGLPTVLGWKTHEWLWQSGETAEYPEICSTREQAIKEIYTSSDAERVQELIDEYNIEYIYVGGQEKNKYELPVNHSILMSMGEVVYPQGMDLSLAENTTYIIKIKK